MVGNEIHRLHQTGSGGFGTWFDNVKKTLIREGVHNEINPFDRRAITFATTTKEQNGGEVIVMTMGPPQAKEGVRGAFNHMVGIGRARIIVAINKDPNALIFKNCDYGIVGDYAEVVPAFTHMLRERKATFGKT